MDTGDDIERRKERGARRSESKLHDTIGREVKIPMLDCYELLTHREVVRSRATAMLRLRRKWHDRGSASIHFALIDVRGISET